MKGSLILMMEKTKIKMTTTLNQIIYESGLPAYLIEGMLVDILCNVREQKNSELLHEFNYKQQSPDKQEPEQVTEPTEQEEGEE